jgi:hypothetical protein
MEHKQRERDIVFWHLGHRGGLKKSWKLLLDAMILQQQLDN